MARFENPRMLKGSHLLVSAIENEGPQYISGKYERCVAGERLPMNAGSDHENLGVM